MKNEEEHHLFRIPGSTELFSTLWNIFTSPSRYRHFVLSFFNTFFKKLVEELVTATFVFCHPEKWELSSAVDLLGKVRKTRCTVKRWIYFSTERTQTKYYVELYKGNSSQRL